MKTPLRQRWALFVLRYSRSRIWPYACVLLTLALIILQFTRHPHVHFLLVMLPVTLMAYERLAFAELFAHQNRRIEELLNEHK